MKNDILVFGMNEERYFRWLMVEFDIDEAFQEKYETLLEALAVNPISFEDVEVDCSKTKKRLKIDKLRIEGTRWLRKRFYVSSGKIDVPMHKRGDKRCSFLEFILLFVDDISVVTNARKQDVFLDLLTNMQLYLLTESEISGYRVDGQVTQTIDWIVRRQYNFYGGPSHIFKFENANREFLGIKKASLNEQLTLYLEYKYGLPV